MLPPTLPVRYRTSTAYASGAERVRITKLLFFARASHDARSQFPTARAKDVLFNLLHPALCFDAKALCHGEIPTGLAYIPISDRIRGKLS